jgi:hypothetical protein
MPRSRNRIVVERAHDAAAKNRILDGQIIEGQQ